MSGKEKRCTRRQQSYQEWERIKENDIFIVAVMCEFGVVQTERRWQPKATGKKKAKVKSENGVESPTKETKLTYFFLCVHLSAQCDQLRPHTESQQGT